MKFFTSLLVLATVHVGHCFRFRGSARNITRQAERKLADYYYTNTDVGDEDPDAAIGNPMRGLIESPRYSIPPWTANIPATMEFLYIGLDEVMFGKCGDVGTVDSCSSMGIFDGNGASL
jgi:hypothetical protein